MTALRWHPAGHHVLSGSRDNLLKLFDLRTMREQATFKHHKREVPALTRTRTRTRTLTLTLPRLGLADPVGSDIQVGARARARARVRVRVRFYGCVLGFV